MHPTTRKYHVSFVAEYRDKASAAGRDFVHTRGRLRSADLRPIEEQIARNIGAVNVVIMSWGDVTPPLWRRCVDAFVRGPA